MLADQVTTFEDYNDKVYVVVGQCSKREPLSQYIIDKSKEFFKESWAERCDDFQIYSSEDYHLHLLKSSWDTLSPEQQIAMIHEVRGMGYAHADY